MSTTITPRQIYNEMSTEYLGNEEVKRSLSVLGYMHACNILHKLNSKYKVYAGKSHEDLKPETFNNNILLLGKSGSGKTYGAQQLVKSLNKILGIELPICIIDCTALSPTGYKGGDIDKTLGQFFSSPKPYQEYSVIVFDEFDKLTTEASNKDEEFYRRVQYQILRLVEGAHVNVDHNGKEFDITSHNFLFVFCGNFPSIRYLRAESEKVKVNYGFLDNPSDDKPKGTTLDKIAGELEKVGVASQLLGRLTAVAETDALGRDQLRQLLLKKAGVYTRFAPHNIGIASLSEEQIENILDSAEGKDTGIRAIDARIHDIIYNRMFEEDVTFSKKSEEELRAEELREVLKDESVPVARLEEIIGEVLKSYNLFSYSTFLHFRNRLLAGETHEARGQVLDDLVGWCDKHKSGDLK